MREETDTHSMCVCDWQLLAVTIVLALLIVGHGEIEGRRRSHAGKFLTQRKPAVHRLPENSADTDSQNENTTEPLRSHSGEIT